MKGNYIVFLVFWSLTFSSFAQTAQKDFINYQGVARNAEGMLLTTTQLTLGIALHFGAANAPVAYEESHILTTDVNGVFSLQIGNGNRVSGDYGTLPWGREAAFISASVNGTIIGTTEMMAVPYAISSGDAQQTAEEVPYDNTLSGLTATNAQAAIDALVGGGTINTDNQNLIITGDVLSIEGGTGSIDLSAFRNDDDADPNNELQTLSFDVASNQLSLTNGNTVTIPNGGTDADPDPNNEIQDISLDGTEISITRGSTVDLAPLIPPGGSDNQNLELTGDVLSIEGGTGSVDLGTYVNDADFDPLNEVDVTAQTGILLGDGTDVTGLVGTTDGQVPKWNATVSAWIPGEDETGTGGSGAEELNDLSDAITDIANESLFIGNSAGTNNIGAINTAVGDFALFRNTTGQNNTAFGTSTLANNETTNNNTAFGARALSQNIASLNTAVGASSLTFNTTGEQNTAVGSFALRSNTIGAGNTAIGVTALNTNTEGQGNTAVGALVLRDNISGDDNTGIGAASLALNTAGEFNTAIGRSSLNRNTTGDNNTAIGGRALNGNASGGNNTAIGYESLGNVVLGHNNIGIGWDAEVPDGNDSNQVRMGNTQISLAQIQVAWTVTSDRRWKTDIQDLPYGLNMITQLRPVDYLRKNNDRQTRETGFIAQEVEQVLQQLGYEHQGILTKDDRGFMSLRYNDFIPVFTKAIQEQQNQIKVLQTQVYALQEQVQALITEHSTQTVPNNRHENTKK